MACHEKRKTASALIKEEEPAQNVAKMSLAGSGLGEELHGAADISGDRAQTSPYKACDEQVGAMHLARSQAYATSRHDD
jgi:hypothetical protein